MSKPHLKHLSDAEFPEQISALGKAVAKAARRLEKGLAKQREGVVGMAEELVRASTAAVKAARNLKEWPSNEKPAVDDEVFAKLSGVVRASFETLHVDPARPDELDELTRAAERPGAALDDASHELANQAALAVGMAWQNAIAAHQQQNVLAEAVLTQGVQMLFSLAGDALSEKQELELDALTRAARQEQGGFDEVYEVDDPYADHRDDDENDDEW